MPSWSLFRLVCVLHATINIVTGLFMVFRIDTLARLIHGEETTKSLHLTSNDEKSQLIKTSESLVGMMLIFIAMLLYMISHLEQIEFQRYVSKGCILIHLLLATWRILVQGQVQVLQKDLKGQVILDFIFAMTWIAVLVFARSEMRNIKQK